MERDGFVSLSGGPCSPGTEGSLAANHPGRHGRGGQSRGTLRTRNSDLVPPLWRDASLAGIGMEAVRSRNECTRASKLVGLVRDGPWQCAGKNDAAVGMATHIPARCPYRMAESQQKN